MFNLAVSGSAQFSGAISFNCSGAPTLATCSVSPNPVTMQSATPANITVTVTTTASGAAAATGRPATPWRVLPIAPLVLFVIAIAGLAVMLPVGKRRRLVWAAPMLTLVLCAGCGGGSQTKTPSPNPGTPAGTYTLTVTATTNGVNRTVNLTLIVK